MTARTPKYRPRRINGYVPALAYAVDVIDGGPLNVEFGPLAAASTTAILNAQSMATAGTATLGGANALVTDTVDASSGDGEFPYGPGFGRSLACVASGASTGTVTIVGKDYLGQPMKETVTLNGTTAVNTKKAFKYVDSVSWTVTAATTLSVGTTSRLGLPYRFDNVLTEQFADVRVSTLGTLTTPDLTDPATATTGDPRGLYVPNSTLDGASRLSAMFIVNKRLNASGNGGLYGIQHFFS